MEVEVIPIESSSVPSPLELLKKIEPTAAYIVWSKVMIIVLSLVWSVLPSIGLNEVADGEKISYHQFL